MSPTTAVTSLRAVDRLAEQLGQLVATQTSAVDLDALAERYTDDFPGFARDVLQLDLWTKQLELAALVTRSPLVVCPGGQGVGKDTLASAYALYWLYVRRGRVLVTSRTEKQLVEIFMGELGRHWRRSGLPGELRQLGLYTGRDGADLIGKTATEASALQGFHHARMLCLLSEAQALDADIFQALLACAVGHEDRCLAYGNPLMASGTFAEVARPNSGWQVLRISCLDHPNIDGSGRYIEGGPSPRWVEQQRSLLGAGSPLYGSRVLALFPSQDEFGLVPRAWCEAAAERWAAQPVADAPARERVILACDVARYGSAQTCVAVRTGDMIRELVLWRAVDLMESVRRVAEVGWRWGCTPRQECGSPNKLVRAKGYVVVDVVGLGAGLNDRLHQLGYQTIQFNGGEKTQTTGPGGVPFSNRRASSFWTVRTALERGTLCLPPDDLLFDELVSLRWRPAPTGKIELEPKLDLTTRIGRSCDRADSVAMALAADGAYSIGCASRNL